jgi:hypothetical protein
VGAGARDADGNDRAIAGRPLPQRALGPAAPPRG